MEPNRSIDNRREQFTLFSPPEASCEYPAMAKIDSFKILSQLLL